MLAIISALTMAAACDPPSLWCSCFPPREPQTQSEAREYIERADAVLVGTVTSLDTAQVSLYSTPEQRALWGDVSVTLVVREHWRGTPADTVVVHTAWNAGWCGVKFVKGGTYLVLAHAAPQVGSASGERLVSWGCGQSRPLAKARQLRRLLGAPPAR